MQTEKKSKMFSSSKHDSTATQSNIKNQKLKIILIHYHLKTGGVTTVINQQVKALAEAGCDILVLTGEAAQVPFPALVHVISGLAYDNLLNQPVTVQAICRQIQDIVIQQWPQGPDLVHVHNPTLAKNRYLQAVLKALQQLGWPILCQIHDFAEDGRPDAYFKESYLRDCHYATINSRDYRLLQNTGLRSAGLHLLPNPVIALPFCQSEQIDPKAPVLYPIRAIRRKNIGEAVLLAHYLRGSSSIAITLPPNSDQDMQAYQCWHAFVDQYRLPVEFDVGLNANFKQLMGKCRYVLTTSITEGFGFSFLETWTAGKALWGRLLPEICQDFTAHGLNLDHLYTHLQVPLNWLKIEDLARRWQKAMYDAGHKFDYDLTTDQIENNWRSISAHNYIDFGLLDERFQQQVITRVMRDEAAMHHLANLNPFLQHPGPPQQVDDLIAHNRQAVLQYYEHRIYGRRLLEVYHKTLNTPLRHSIDKTILLDTFLAPQQFSLLKWGAYHV